MPLSEDLTEIERAGRRCASCHSGRRWRQLEVVRRDGQEPVVMCAACRARYGTATPTPVAQPAAAAAAAPVAPAPAPAPEPASAPQPAPGEDRLRRALRELPRGAHSVAQIAKAAGLNHERTLNRLRALHAAGEVQHDGKRWSNEPPSTDIDAAFARLEARTSNLRIVRDREPVA